MVSHIIHAFFYQNRQLMQWKSGIFEKLIDLANNELVEPFVCGFCPRQVSKINAMDMWTIASGDLG